MRMMQGVATKWVKIIKLNKKEMKSVILYSSRGKKGIERKSCPDLQEISEEEKK